MLDTQTAAEVNLTPRQLQQVREQSSDGTRRRVVMATTEINLIPVRALNQFTYCPRLYYLEYVESVMPLNEHVEDGLFQHRRVDNPDLQHRTRKEGDALHTRSVQVSSEKLGITGKLDLVEEKNGAV